MVLELWGWGNGNSSKPNPRISGRRGLHDKPHHAESIWGSTKTEVGGISAGLILVAAFSGNPAAGAAPLMVQFTDLPTGSSSSWSWNFGDGTGSSDKNLVYMYLQPGDYSVSLMVKNSYGSNTRMQNGYIIVSSPKTTEIYLSGSRAGYLLPDGYLQLL